RVIEHSWQMYPIGFLFGLGFDTASEVALLAISAGAAAQGLPFTAVISLPLIFAAGMSLMDTTDGAFMSKAYSWAFASPIRKVFYNLTVTSLSVFVALLVGLVELAQILIRLLGLPGGVFDAIAGVDGPEADRLDELKGLLLGLFVVAGDKPVEPFAVDLRVRHLRRERVVERLDHMRLRSLLLDVLRHRRTVKRLAWVFHIDTVGDVDDHLAVELWSEHADNLIDLVGRHGEDHELRVLDRILGGVGRMGVRRLRRLPSFLWRARGESHLVPRLGRRFRQRLTYIPRADDCNFHSIPPPTCIRRCANRTRIDEAAMLTTTAPTSPELT